MSHIAEFQSLLLHFANLVPEKEKFLIVALSIDNNKMHMEIAPS